MIEWSLDDDDDSPESNSPSLRVALRPEMLGQRIPKTPPDGPQPIELMQAVNDYARRSGYVTGYPTFNRGQSGDNATLQVVLLNDSNAKTIHMSGDEFYEAISFPPPAFRDHASLLPRLLEATDFWFTAKGYKGALPSFFVEFGPGHVPQFEITLLSSTHYKRRKIDPRELVDLEDVESVFRQVHAWAVKSGFASGFPTFRQQDGQFCILVDPNQAEVREIRIDELIFDRRP